MQKKSIFLLISLCMLMALPGKPFAQSSTALVKLDSLECCPGSTLSYPILVSNILDVDSFNLVLSYNPSAIDFISSSQLNDLLIIPNDTLGSYSILEESGTITINWFRKTAFSIINDTLMSLIFSGKSGNTQLQWDLTTAGNCIFHTQGGGLLSTQFENGNAKVYPPLHVVLSELNETCKGKCDANFMATASGGTKPYLFLWNNKPGRFDSIQTNLCDSINTIHIIDSKGCELDSTYLITGLPGPSITLIKRCDGIEVDSLFRENPVLSFQVETEDAIKPSFDWDFGDGFTESTSEPTVTHTYAGASDPAIKKYELSLRVINSNDCDSIYKFTIHIKDDSIIKINNVLVPSGTPKNRVFVVADNNDPDWTPLIHQFKYIEVVIFDRWGRKVYANSDYQCDWKAEGLPDGVYYYVVKIVGFFNTKKYKGSLTILGSGK